jgi:hypothetical protein
VDKYRQVFVQTPLRLLQFFIFRFSDFGRKTFGEKDIPTYNNGNEEAIYYGGTAKVAMHKEG